MPYTHQKRPYRARVVFWDGDNLKEIAEVLDDVTLFGSDKLIVRWHGGVDTLNIGDAVVVGENGVVKTYPYNIFKIKYMEI